MEQDDSYRTFFGAHMLSHKSSLSKCRFHERACSPLTFERTLSSGVQLSVRSKLDCTDIVELFLRFGDGYAVRGTMPRSQVPEGLAPRSR